MGTGEKQQIHEKITALCKTVSSRQKKNAGTGYQVEAWTHYTHFDIVDEDFMEISTAYLWNCWKRGVAIQLPHRQLDIDGINPFFVGDLKSDFTSSSPSSTQETVNRDVIAAGQMTYVAWEAKNPKNQQQQNNMSGTTTAKVLLAGPKLPHPESLGQPLTSRGVLTVLTDLGAADKYKKPYCLQD